MSEAGTPRRSPISNGEVVNSPFVRLPEPKTHFRLRAQCFAVPSQGPDLESYLRLMVGLAEVQHRVQDGLPEPDTPAPDARERAREFGTPPLDRDKFTADAALDTTLLVREAGYRRGAVNPFLLGY